MRFTYSEKQDEIETPTGVDKVLELSVWYSRVRIQIVNEDHRAPYSLLRYSQLRIVSLLTPPLKSTIHRMFFTALNFFLIFFSEEAHKFFEMAMNCPACYRDAPYSSSS